LWPASPPEALTIISLMKLSDDNLREFTVLWEEEFHDSLGREEALHLASQLLELYALLARPSDEPECQPSNGDAPAQT
jgi:hypothetical protein